MVDVMWRAVRRTDAAGLVPLFDVVARTAPIGLQADLSEIESRLSRPGLDLEQDTLVAVDATSGVLLAYAETADMGVGQGQFRIRLTSATHPDLGTEGIRRLHEWLIERAGQLHLERRPDLPGVLGARCAATDHARLSLLTDSGFRIAGWQKDLIRAVDQRVPPPPTPPDVMIVPYDPRYNEATRIAHNDAYLDTPGALLPDARGWPQHAVGLPNFLPDASFLALGNTPAGQDIAAFLFSLERRDISGVREASLHCLATRKPWRGRGLATSLIGRALTSYRLTGFTRARLQVDTHNSDAVNLYAKLGFVDSGRSYAALLAPTHPALPVAEPGQPPPSPSQDSRYREAQARRAIDPLGGAQHD